MDEYGDRLITREEAARLLGVKPQTLASWAVKGWYDNILPVIKINNRVRYRLSNILNFIEIMSESCHDG